MDDAHDDRKAIVKQGDRGARQARSLEAACSRDRCPNDHRFQIINVCCASRREPIEPIILSGQKDKATRRNLRIKDFVTELGEPEDILDVVPCDPGMWDAAR